jgi:hypothetical protein
MLLLRTAIVVLLLSAPGTVLADPSPSPPPPADLAEGIRQVRAGDLEDAVITLDDVVRRLTAEQADTRLLSQAYAYLAIAYIGLAQQEKAKQQFLEAWKIDKTLALSPHEFPPRVVEMFEQTKREAEWQEARATPRPKAGGARKLLLGAAGVAAGVGVAVAARGGGGTPTPTANPNVELFDNTFVEEGSAGAFPTDSLAACQTNCLAAEYCKAFVFQKPTPEGYCYLKSLIGTKRPDTCCILGIIRGR